MQKKKIIAFIDWYIPGYKAGGGQRAFANMVSYLRETFDFYIITRNTDFLETIPYEGIESEKWVECNKGEYVFYCPESKVNQRLYKKLIQEVRPDEAYINGVYSWKFSILPLIVLKNIGFKGKKVLGTYGMLAPTAINIKRRKKQLFIILSRLYGLYKNVLFHATSEKEIEDIKNALGKKVKVQIAPHLPVKELPDFKKLDKKHGELKLISIARISPEKNTLFALEQLKYLQVEGTILYDLYGPIYDKLYWQECQNVIKELTDNIKVKYKGVVDGNQVLDLFTNYHALFMPTRGENFGYVILESFMASRPVIISDQTPWRGLEEEKSGFDLDLNKSTDYKSALAGWDLTLVNSHQSKVNSEKQGKGSKEAGERKKEKRSSQQLEGNCQQFSIDSKQLTESRWSNVLNLLVDMEQQEFDIWCEGARKRAERFINDPALEKGNISLFD
ncbi:glycosyltransferase family 4 protein [Saccharicrinis sp. 156]|uniref:glycosyltransferase family 4 protein n=1 Tax=Saccharicrinis sp. 156 TaxID=3417574 RepID=UPI003D33F1FE